MKNRITIDKYFLNICNSVSKRATCPRKSVGCTIVKDGRILSSGYNGSPKGFEHCTEVGCKLINNHCVRVVHAEMNALLFAGRDAKEATLYSTTLPCEICLKLAIQSGIKKIIYEEDYNKEIVEWLLQESEIEIIKYEKCKYCNEYCTKRSEIIHKSGIHNGCTEILYCCEKMVKE
jgi:dCMP deaminase